MQGSLLAASAAVVSGQAAKAKQQLAAIAQQQEASADQGPEASHALQASLMLAQLEAQEGCFDQVSASASYRLQHQPHTAHTLGVGGKATSHQPGSMHVAMTGTCLCTCSQQLELPDRLSA